MNIKELLRYSQFKEYITHFLSSIYKDGEICYKMIFKYLKNILIFFTTIIIPICTFLFVYKSYNSPSQFNCDFELIQRPDSIYQAQIYLWNSGDKPVENIIFNANSQNVFLYDSSKNKSKLNLLVYPNLTLSSTLTPSKILNHLGREIDFKNHKIIISKLPKSSKYENYFIIMPYFENKIVFISKQNSIFEDKFIDLKKIEGTKSYENEVLENVKIIADGKLQIFKLSKIRNLSNIDTTEYYFPKFKEFIEYRSFATPPDYLLPPLLLMKILKERKEKDENLGFKRYKRFKGFKKW